MEKVATIQQQQQLQHHLNPIGEVATTLEGQLLALEYQLISHSQG
jgi:hypothetical protein